jgi:hypothetical protein
MPIVCANALVVVKTIGIEYSRRVNADALKSLARANGRDKAREKRSHDALVDAIWEAADEGWQQVDIVKATGLTRERIRQLCDPEYRRRALERRPKDNDGVSPP